MMQAVTSTWDDIMQRARGEMELKNAKSDSAAPKPTSAGPSPRMTFVNDNAFFNAA